MKNTCCAMGLLVLMACSGTEGPAPVGDQKDTVEELLPDATSPEVIFKHDLQDVAAEQLDFETGNGGDTFSPRQCNPGEGCFLDQCNENTDCQSSWCVEHLGEGVCTQTCQEECPQRWKCKQVGGTEPDVVSICVSDHANLCKPCEDSDDCGSTGGAEDVCVDYGAEGNFCGGQCEVDGDCPWGFSCRQALTIDGLDTTQCVNDAEVCPCTDKSVALSLWTPCDNSNDWGTCAGKRVCMEEGLTDCNAAIPAEETCNGLDDDCDNETDEPPLVEGEYGNLCNDDNDCTEDKCKAEDGCENLPTDGAECMDGDPCTMADHCVQDVCVGTPVECKDDNPCTDDSCDETGGCVFTPNNDACDDGNPCSVGDQCKETECIGLELPCDCQANEDCAQLEDGNICNGILICNTNVLPYKCEVDAATIIECDPPEESPDAVCQQAHCVPETGECQVIPANDGFACNDSNACTAGDKCVVGACTPGIVINCADDNPCTNDSCDALEGCIHKPNEEPCSDGDICTVDDGCIDGACVPGDGWDCEDGNACTEDQCEADVGCVHNALSDTPCDDGNACSTGDHCNTGVCVFDGPTPCNDGDECTDDSCDPAAGCVFSLNEAPCDDGNLCTLQDHCDQGQCVGGEQLICDDGDPCTDDSCQEGLGCSFVLNEAPCDDGDLCTDSDACALGICSGVLKDCSDDNPCTTNTCHPVDGCMANVVEDGANCGEGVQWQCADGECLCVPHCDGVACGDDLCGGSCGECGEGLFCFVGQCYEPLGLADTGQTLCYADEGVLDPCPDEGAPFYGQDGNYLGKPMDFTDNGDGTVADNVTGLVWAKCSAGQDPIDCTGFGAALEWQEAMDYCANNTDGLPGDGWRLPSRLELLSMTDFEKPHCLDKSVFGGEVVAGYWSSTTGGSPASACGISFGTCASGCAYQKENFQTFFRCVRGAPKSSGDFEAMGNDTVRDYATDLQWQQGVSPGQMKWSDALDYCEGLVLAGYDDWRLPNAKEVASLIDFTPPLWIVAEQFFGDTPKGGFWTATTFKSWTSRGFALGSGGALGDFSNIKTMELLARCVRDFCIPDCEGKECGNDGCGGSCPPGCDPTSAFCNAQFQCQTKCGNEVCDFEETCGTCPVYCGDCCGNQICDNGETVGTCPWDCVEDCEPGIFSGKKTGGEHGVLWVEIPAGCFIMGCSLGGGKCADSENPPHAVTVSPFEINETEITEGQYLLATGDDPSMDQNGGGGEESPVESVTWSKARAFCEALAPDGRLCTEAEWEHAARAGTTTRYYCGNDASCLDEIAWYDANSDDGLGIHKHDVKIKAPNAYGLFDMQGNVSEWVEDCKHDDYDMDDDGKSDWNVSYPAWTSDCTWLVRGNRGGHYGTTQTNSRVSLRGFHMDQANGGIGIRCCRSIPEGCVPDCAGKECGGDGCGGSCGTCPPGKSCDTGQCVVKCGDGQCGAGEDTCNCPEDCTGGCAGCCSGTECMGGTSNEDCGKDGAACESCSDGKTCQNQACASTNTPTWSDPTSKLTWQNPPFGGTKTWSAAKQYCTDLSLDGDGWHLPTISELRTLVRECPGTVTGGACKVTDSCLSKGNCWSESACASCSVNGGPANGCYWPDEMQGICNIWYWSSSPIEDIADYAWFVGFNSGLVDFGINVSSAIHVRCVRDAP